MGVQGKYGHLPWLLLLIGVLSLVHGDTLEKSAGSTIENLKFLTGVHLELIRNYQTGSPGTSYPESCSVIKNGQSGLYIIEPVQGRRIVVNCVLGTEGGWTIIQKNCLKDRKMWDATWESYKRGFGDPRGEHWLGNEYIHLLTSQKMQRIRFRMLNAAGKNCTANYDYFSLEGEQNCYRIRLGRYSGTAGDAMTSGVPEAGHDNMKFSTHDRDNDLSGMNCAFIDGGGGGGGGGDGGGSDGGGGGGGEGNKPTTPNPC
uniref:Fibrinogen-like protein 1-like protein n=1 Tax=Xenopus tropicalis TaxID=8364 RepID=A0A803KD62_XENTR